MQLSFDASLQTFEALSTSKSVSCSSPTSLREVGSDNITAVYSYRRRKVNTSLDQPCGSKWLGCGLKDKR